MSQYLPEYTVKYLTYLKRAVQEGLQDVFDHHPDPLLNTRDENYHGRTVRRGTKVTLEYPRTKDRYPAVVIRFFERSAQRMGVGHVEYLQLQDDDRYRTKMYHDIYTGDLEFGIYGLSSYDRDVMSNTVAQVITMGDLEAWTNRMWESVYGPRYSYADLADPDIENVPDAHWNFISIDRDTISGFGETQAPVPWQAEDDQLYVKQYRVAVMGEFYSVPPRDLSHELVQEVPTYPYIEDTEPVPEGDPDDLSDWM